MTLRNRLLALSLLTLLLPWSGWKLLQELEGFLRQAQENAGLSVARTLAGALPIDSQSQLLYAPERYAVLRKLDYAPDLDGFLDEWPDEEQGLELVAPDGSLRVRLMAGEVAGGLYLGFDLRDESLPLAAGTGRNRDGLKLLLRSPRGLLSFLIEPEAPGPLQLHADGGGGQAEGYWLDVRDGYRVELMVPGFARNVDIAFTFAEQSSAPDPNPDADASLAAGATADARPVRTVSTRLAQSERAEGEEMSDYPGSDQPAADNRRPDQHAWIALMPAWSDLSSMLANSIPAVSRAWLVDRDGWVLADSGPVQDQPRQQTTWVQRLLYRVVAGRLTLVEPFATGQVRLQSAILAPAIAGQEGTGWARDPDTAVVHNTVAVPVRLDGKVRGAIVLQSASDGLLLVTNRALGRLLITTLAITFGLAGGLWLFATRLSRRVRRLGSAVSEAMHDGVAATTVPLTRDRDELGELARNNEKLLRAVADYKQYLQTLAGKLSHELKTPLAITRSSLENLSSQPLGPAAQQFLQRAQEGVDRQAAIVRAMSESSRLEAAIRLAEWEQADLAELVSRCAQGYNAAHPGRQVQVRIGTQPLRLRCAPELLAQALDKLVDNAISMTADTDTVSIGLERAGDEVRLSVRNSGSRLPDEFQDRLFDSLVSVREKRGPGPHLGLGLYIVRLVAEAHGGSVNAQNLPQGQGVEFVMRLPAHI
jgi:signal transduction histidine kinase